jgi:predicted enzyme related to lactoylglutathione lyase
MNSRVAVAALVLVAISMSSIVAAATFTPLVAPANQEHHVGKVIFLELVTPDLAAAKAFYAGLFGWAFRDVTVGTTEYAEGSLNGHPVAGLARRELPSAARRQPAWLAFLAVNDADATSKTALLGGAKLLAAPHTVAGRGREAVFADPQGAVFAVLASSSGDPPDVLAAPGEWIWSSLITSDPDTDAAFYQTLFDYEVFDLPADKGEQHLMLASESFARASANTLPDNRPDARAHWLSYVRVDDMDASVAKLVALGGHMLVEPRLDRHGGRVAVVADPLGAAFGLLEWKAGVSKEEGE